MSEMMAAFFGTGWQGLSKLEFAKGIMFLHKFYKHNPITQTGKIITSASQLRIAAYFIGFSLPTYGAAALNVFGYGRGLHDLLRPNAHISSLLHHLSLDRSDILAWQFEASELYKPNFFACYDNKTKSVIVSIRGTFNLHEALVDSHATYHPFLSGHGHKGMIHATQHMESTYLDKMFEWVEKRHAKGIYFVGHSLGSAVTSLFVIKHRDIFIQRFGEGFKCEAVNFATPACVSRDLLYGTEGYITSYVNGNDIVPTLVMLYNSRRTAG
jgi:Lipase (class 3)